MKGYKVRMFLFPPTTFEYYLFLIEMYKDLSADTNFNITFQFA